VKKLMKRLSGNASFTGILASLLSIAAGLLVGLVLLFAFNSRFAMYGFGQILTAGLSSGEKFAKVLYQAAPLICTGLSVGFAFKTGLFNIGATGQFTVGAFCALYAVIRLQLPWYCGLIAALLGGAFWGVFPGWFKAQFNVNEVITSILFNWIGMFLVNLLITNIPLMLANAWGASNMDRTAALSAANPKGILPKAGLDKLTGSNFINVGIFVAMVFAALMWVILSKTTFGYELKACGFNRAASTYAGISARRNIVLSMVISGAMSGLGGGITYLSGTVQYTLVKSLLPAGFNGIPVALLASSHPIGTIFSALFISYIQVGGDAMQPEFIKEIIDIIIAAIIYLSAFSLLMRSVIVRLLRARHTASESGANE